jgi:hypothetical protein
MAENQQDTAASASAPVTVTVDVAADADAVEEPTMSAPNGGEFLSAEEMEELQAHGPAEGDIVNGVADQAKMAAQLKEVLYQGRKFRNMKHKKAFVMFFAEMWGDGDIRFGTKKSIG